MSRENFKLYFNFKNNPLLIANLTRERITDTQEKYFFEYSPDWLFDGYSLGSDLPLQQGVFETDRLHPYFGFMYDILPGITARQAVSRMLDKPLNNMDLALRANDTLRPGALEFKVKNEVPFSAKVIPKVVLDIDRLMRGHPILSDIESLYRCSDALPGERFKLSYLSSKNLNIIAKFNHPDPQRNLVTWEVVSLILAKKLGLTTVRGSLGSFRGLDALLTERFDRDPLGHKIGYASAKALLAAHDAAECHWAQLSDILTRDGDSPKKDLAELWQRLVFFMCIGNVNDDLSNIGFVRARYGWRLAPIFSMSPTPLPPSRRHHTTAVTDDCDRPDLLKAIEIARYFGLSQSKARTEAMNIASFVQKNWEKTAMECRADPLETETMRKAFEPLEL